MDALEGRARLLATGAGVLVLIGIIAAAGEEEALVIGTISGAAYGLVALGLVLIYKSSGVFNFAQGEFGTVAVYVLYLLHFHVPHGVALLGALAAATLFGFVVERVVVRPLFEAPRVILLVATAGIALLAVAVEIWFGGAQGKPIERALPSLDRATVLGVQLSDQRLMLIALLVGLAALLGFFFTRTDLGVAILAASQQPTATELVGVSVRRLSTLVWAIAALLGGIAGVIAIPENGSFTPGVVTFSFLIPAFTAAVLGGMTSLPGAFLGGILVGVVQAVATSAPAFDDIPGTPGTLMVFVVLLLVLTIRPQGILGKGA